MDVPQPVTDAVNAATAKHPEDIPRAVRTALAAIRRLPDYASFLDTLMNNAILELIYDARHAANVRMKRQQGCYGGPAKVQGTSDAVDEVYRSVYLYHLAGRTLGSLTGGELLPLAQTLTAQGNGLLKDAALLEALAPLVPEDKTVFQAMPEKRLKSLFRKIMGC